MDIPVETALRIAEILSILSGGGAVAYRLGRTTQRMEQAMETQRSELNELRGSVKELSRLMTEVALQKQRLDMHQAQLEEFGEYIRWRRSTA